MQLFAARRLRSGARYGAKATRRYPISSLIRMTSLLTRHYNTPLNHSRPLPGKSTGVRYDARTATPFAVLVVVGEGIELFIPG